MLTFENWTSGWGKFLCYLTEMTLHVYLVLYANTPLENSELFCSYEALNRVGWALPFYFAKWHAMNSVFIAQSFGGGLLPFQLERSIYCKASSLYAIKKNMVFITLKKSQTGTARYEAAFSLKMIFFTLTSHFCVVLSLS